MKNIFNTLCNGKRGRKKIAKALKLNKKEEIKKVENCKINNFTTTYVGQAKNTNMTLLITGIGKQKNSNWTYKIFM